MIYEPLTFIVAPATDDPISMLDPSHNNNIVLEPAGASLIHRIMSMH